VFFLNDVALKKLLSPYFHLVRKDFIKNVEPTLDSKRSAAYDVGYVSKFIIFSSIDHEKLRLEDYYFEVDI
jgi:hypothetical protein